MNNAKDYIIHTVFEVSNTKELLTKYLYLFFQRTEFDRYARFNSWGSARETFDWAEMCNIKLPIPDIKIQEAYHTLETRKRIKQQLKNSKKPLFPVLMPGVVEEMETLKVNA